MPSVEVLIHAQGGATTYQADGCWCLGAIWVVVSVQELVWVACGGRVLGGQARVGSEDGLLVQVPLHDAGLVEMVAQKQQLGRRVAHAQQVRHCQSSTIDRQGQGSARGVGREGREWKAWSVCLTRGAELVERGVGHLAHLALVAVALDRGPQRQVALLDLQVGHRVALNHHTTNRQTRRDESQGQANSASGHQAVGVRTDSR